MSSFKFEFNWKITLFSVLLLPLLISLGFWQLSRAQQKETLQQSWLEEQALPPVHYRELLDRENASGARRVFAEGSFDTQKYWLVENKILAGKLGYHLVAPFYTEYQDWLLVNLGWVPADAYREVNPEVIIPAGKLRISGTLRTPSDSRFIEQKPDNSGEWPFRLLEIDFPLMNDQYGKPFETRVIFADADSPGAQLVSWQPINMTPERHRGYALQWFAMAFALLVLWFVTNTNVLKGLTLED